MFANLPEDPVAEVEAREKRVPVVKELATKAKVDEVVVPVELVEVIKRLPPVVN